jgi:hypothetical protein
VSRTQRSGTVPRMALEVSGEALPSRAPTRVLFIAGFGRSGSTVLGQVLGATPGFVHVGELNFIWEHNFRENRHCGCGLAFDECPFWKDVIGRAFGGFDGVDAYELSDMARQSTRTRHSVAMLAPRGHARLVRRARPYLDAMDRLYRAVRDVSGADVVVDSSKLPAYGYLVGAAPGIDLRVVHLVRDPRATAYSWLRRSRTEGDANRAYLPRIGTTESALTWDTWNVVTELMWRDARDRYLRVRYEDLVTKPLEQVRRVVTHAGLGGTELPFVGDHTVRLDVAHTAAGNPNRFAQGEVEITADEEWRDAISRGQLLAVTALTLPVMRRYGYAPTRH